MKQVENSDVIKEYDQMVREEIDEGENLISNSFYDDYKLNNEEENFEILKVNFHFYILIEVKEFFFNFYIEMNNKEKIKDIILKAVSMFNNKHYQIELNKEYYELSYSERKEDIDRYELRQTKKNLKPKLDMPPFYKEASSQGLANEEISFVANSKGALIMQKIKKVKEQKNNSPEIEKEGNNSGSCKIF